MNMPGDLSLLTKVLKRASCLTIVSIFLLPKFLYLCWIFLLFASSNLQGLASSTDSNLNLLKRSSLMEYNNSVVINRPGVAGAAL